MVELSLWSVCSLLLLLNQGDKDYLARLLPVGHELCILPKTCLNSFGANQPVYDLGDRAPLCHALFPPPQVASVAVELVSNVSFWRCVQERPLSLGMVARGLTRLR